VHEFYCVEITNLVENEAFTATPMKIKVFWDIILFRLNITAAVSVDPVASLLTRGSKLL
jgi:hypothetical protein